MELDDNRHQENPIELDQPSTVGSKDVIGLFHNTIESLERQVKSLSEEVEAKNSQIDQTNRCLIDSTKENDILKCDIANIREQNLLFEKELQELKSLLNCDHRDSNQINTLIDELNSNICEQQKSRKECLLENIENRFKLQKANDELRNLRQKSDISNQWLDHKSEYTDLLVGYVGKLKEDYNSLQASFDKELAAQRNLSTSLKDGNSKLMGVCHSLKTKHKSDLEKLLSLSAKHEELSQKYDQLELEKQELVQKSQADKESYSLEIKNLNELLKQSKNQITDQVLEKYYPNLSSIRQMFDKKLSVSELYSLYLDCKKQNEDLLVEKSVLEDRVRSLDTEAENMRFVVEKNNEQSILLHHLESKVSRIENEKKECDISLSFYHESANNLYRGIKKFNTNFVDMSNEIRKLAQQTEQNSTSTMALKHIERIQSEIQDFGKLQSEFEKNKLNFINKKQNLIETDSEIEHLKSQVSLAEIEKRQLVTQINSLKSELQLAQSYSEMLVQNSEITTNEVRRVNSDLENKISRLSEENQAYGGRFQALESKLSDCERSNGELKRKLSAISGELQFSQQRAELQSKTVEQLNKSLQQQRTANENMKLIKRQLEKNVVAFEQKSASSNKKLIELEMKIIGYEFALDTMQKKEALLLGRLEASQNEVISTEKLNLLLESFKENTESIKTIFGKNFQSLQSEKTRLEELASLNETNWAEERIQLLASVEQVKAQLELEIDNSKRLEQSYAELQQIRSKVNVDGDLEQQLREEVEQSRAEFENYTNRIADLTNELTQLKPQTLELISQNSALLQSGNQLKNEICLLKSDLSTAATQSATLQAEKEAKICALESKLSKLESENSQLQSNSELVELKSVNEQNLVKIESLSQEICHLQAELESVTAAEKRYTLELNSQKDSLRNLQSEYDHLLAKQSGDAQLLSELRKTCAQFQSRYTESERSRIELEDTFRVKLNSITTERDQLQQKNLNLHESYLQLQQRNHSLFERVNLLAHKLSSANECEDRLAELVELKSIIESAMIEIGSLSAEYSAVVSREDRFRTEIDCLKANIGNLEKCLQTEREANRRLEAALESDSSAQQISFLTESVNKLCTTKADLERECTGQRARLATLEAELASSDSLNKIQTKAELDALGSELGQCKEKINQLNLSLNVQIETNAKLENDLKLLNDKCLQQTTELETAKQSLAISAKSTLQYQNELTELKTSSTVNNQGLNMELETLRKDLAKMKNMNEQLKILARKYKSKADELEKQKPDESSNEADLARIKELEAQTATFQAEKCSLGEEIDKLKEDVQRLQNQLEETNQKAKRIAQNAKEKLSQQHEMILRYKSQLAHLKQTPSSLLLTRPQSSKTSVSSTFVSASMQQQPSTSSFDPSVGFNIQPSSSNEDNDRVQSAQITSHTTSLDDNSLESFSNSDSIVTSNKRGFTSFEHQTTTTKRRRKNADPGFSEDDSVDQSMVEEEEEDSNDVGSVARDSAVEFEPNRDDDDDDVQEGNAQATDDSVAESNGEEVEAFEVGRQTESSDETNASSSQSRPESAAAAAGSFEQSSFRSIDSSASGSTTLLTLGSNLQPFYSPNSRPVVEIVEHRIDYLEPSTPRLIIPAQPDLLSPPNHPLLTPNLNQTATSVAISATTAATDDSVVPSTPVLIHHPDDHPTSAQVPQSPFRFGTYSPSNLANSSHLSPFVSVHVTPTTPTISETVSSVISVDEAIAAIEPPFSQHDESSQEESIPTSSNMASTSQSESQNTNSNSSIRSRRLRIRGSSRGRQ